MRDSVKDIIKKEFKNFEKSAYLVVANAEKYKITKNTLITMLVEYFKLRGIYVSLNEPCTLLYSDLGEKVMGSKNILIIDSVCKKLGIKNAKNCVQLTKPGDLTELSLVINDALNTNLFDFLFFDQITILLLTNSLKTTEEFSNFLINKIKLNNVRGVLMCIEEEHSKKILPFLSSLCHKTIKI
ncbi:hypothetical protein HZA97_00100 [Candidatus Woesearchaeota archaeon]|nr:hypothetical protein [Candidatus Woesearchaeota archaeon]